MSPNNGDLSAPVITLRNVSVAFAGGGGVFDISLTVFRGEQVALIGPSGAGKSTLLRVINGMVHASSGQVIVVSQDITKAPDRLLRRVRRRIGMVHQNYNLVPRYTARGNALTGALGYLNPLLGLVSYFPPAVVLKANRVLESVGLADRMFHRADQLSGGQQQRVGIARALLQDPEILLADEPVSNLDPPTALRILELLVSVARERHLTLILSIHDVNYARKFATRIIGLKQGRLVFDSPVSSVTDDILKDLYESGEILR
ncbi:MAG: phosphonate ABC transporter ATP-binding protein [bacterium JZ-2024 1]